LRTEIQRAAFIAVHCVSPAFSGVAVTVAVKRSLNALGTLTVISEALMVTEHGHEEGHRRH
jgi:hypothetical protein